jgi:hypothetical protein
MDEKRATEVLSAHAEELLGRPQAMRQASPTSQEISQLAPLFQLAEQVYRTMRPVQPSAVFVHSLGQELMDGAKRQVVLTKRLRRGVLIGAAAVGSLLSIASVIGAIIFVVVRLRERAQTRAIQATPG